MEYTELDEIRNKLAGFISAMEDELKMVKAVELSPAGYYTGQRMILDRLIRQMKKLMEGIGK